MPNSGNPTWQDSPSTVTPINAAALNALETAVKAAAPVSSAWTASTAVKAGQLLTNAGVLYSVNADMTTPSSFAPTGLTAVSGGGSSSGLPLWQPSTSYTAGQFVVNPSGFIVSANTTHTSGSSYTSGNWTIVDDSRYAQTSTIAPLAQSGQTPSQAPVAPGTTSVGSLAFAARADHVHYSSGVFWWLGDGAMGSATFDGTTTVSLTDPFGAAVSLVPSASVYTLTGPLYLNNLTINSGVTVKTGGNTIHVQGTATVNGTLSMAGASAAGATGGAGAQINDNMLCDGGNGASGGTGAGGTGSAPTRNTIGRGRVAGKGGTGGSSGATAGGGPGNLSGPLTQDNYSSSTILLPFTRLTGFYPAGTAGGNVGGGGGGGAGAGDGTNAGGGGGGGGGVLLMNCRALAGSGTITAKGGNGAAGVGGNAGGGGAGGGGVVFINTTDSSAWTGTLTAANGTAGAGVGTGSAGTVGDVPGFAFLTVFK